METLTEHFYSRLSGKATNRFYDNLPDYDKLVSLTTAKEPFSFLSCDCKHIGTLQISSTAQQLGLSYSKNEGDLNSDGTMNLLCN